MAKVKLLISAAFSQAHAHHKETMEVWIKASAIAGGALPDSELMVSIQRIGQTDILLRCIEKETAADVPQLQSATDVDFTLHHQIMLSEAWICESYEIFRLLQSRKLLGPNDIFKKLAYDLRLLRIPIAKHEIANDRKLTKPLQMHKFSAQGGIIGCHEYSPTDSHKAHIMGKKLSNRGSVEWDAIDGASGNSRWLERLSLSERIVSFWQSSPMLVDR